MTSIKAKSEYTYLLTQGWEPKDMVRAYAVAAQREKELSQAWWNTRAEACESARLAGKFLARTHSFLEFMKGK